MLDGHIDRANLSLLDVCQADVRNSLLLDVELTNFKSGSAPGGSGPSYAKRKSSSHHRELQKAKSIGKEMFPDENSGFLIDPKSSHCPRPKQSKTKKKQNKISSTTDMFQIHKCWCCFQTYQTRPQSLVPLSNPFSQVWQGLPNASSILSRSLQSNFQTNLPSTSFVNQNQHEPQSLNPPTQQFSLTPNFPTHSLTWSPTTTVVLLSHKLRCFPQHVHFPL